MNAPTTWMERFRDALRIMCNNKMPPLEICEKWVNDDESGGLTLQDWAKCNASARWSQGIVTIEAAMAWADRPEEGAGHTMGRWIHVTSCRNCYHITKHGNLPDECMRFNLRIENYDMIHRGCKL